MPVSAHLGMPAAGWLAQLSSLMRSSQVMTVGDSLTYGQDATASAWPLAFASATGISTFNPSRPGWTSVDMAIKVGGINPVLTFASDTIPASGSTTLTAISPSSGYRMATGIAQSYVGVVAGVAGTLTHTANTTTWTFARTTAGNAVATGGSVAFHCTENDAYVPYDLIIMLGRNDMNYSGYTSTITNSLNQIIAHSTGSRFLIVGTIALTTSSDLANVQALGSALQSTFGAAHYFDAQAYLSSNAAMTAVGLTPTSTDSSQMAAGYVPDSLSTTSDRPHLNANGYTSLGQAIAASVESLGWTGSGAQAPGGGSTTGNTGTQPTGSGIVRYQDLVGSTFDARWDAAGANALSLGTGTFSFSDFNATSSQYGADSGSSQGILGSGVDYTTIQMVAGTSSKGSVADSGSVNPYYLLDQNHITGGKFDGFLLNGTNQGHDYNGLRSDYANGVTFSNLKISAVPGSSPSPPGETFYVNVYAGSNPVFDTVEFDGQWAAASTGATNGSTKDSTAAVNGTLTYRRVFAHELKYGKAYAGWQTFGGGTFTECFCVNTAFGYGFEECGGDWTFNNCTFGGNIADLHLGNSHANRSQIVINNPVLLAGQTKIKAYIPPTYTGNGGGNGNAQSAADITIYVNGVDMTSSMLQVITNWVWNSDGSYKGTPITYTAPSWLPWS